MDKVIPIFITSWYRHLMTEQVVNAIRERTTHPHSITVFDNGSDVVTRECLQTYQIDNLILWSKNTGCCFPKMIFNAMAGGSEYYVVTDNDVLCPKLESCWLTQMLGIMDRHEKLGMLALRLPPESLQGPTSFDDEVVYCSAVGNTYKLIRRAAWPASISWPGLFGDDQALSDGMWGNGWQVAFCKNLYCLHIGQTTNWGYEPEQVALDPRKTGYGIPYTYQYDPLTYQPIACSSA